MLINTKVFHYSRRRAFKAGSLQCERDGQEDVLVRSSFFLLLVHSYLIHGGLTSSIKNHGVLKSSEECGEGLKLNLE